MLRLMTMRAAVAWMLVAGLLAGCAQKAPAAPEAAAPPTIAATVSYGPISEPDACPASAAVHVPADLGPVPQAYLCVQQFRPVPGNGVWEYAVVQGVTSGLAALLQVYATPDQKLTDGACAAIYRDPRVVYLHGSRTIAVRAPQDGCGQPTAAAERAYAALGTVDVTVRKLHQVTTQVTLISGCPGQYKDMLAIEEESGGPKGVSPTPRPVGAGAKLCIYQVTGGTGIGQLIAGHELSSTVLDQINAALTTAQVDSSCARHGHTRFALLEPPEGGSQTVVALDGCAVQQDGGWWRASDRLRSLVAG